MGCEFTQIGVGNQGYATTGNGGYPILGSSWNFYKSGVARSFTGLGIDYVFVAEGLNDHGQSGATVTANATGIFTAMRTGTGHFDAGTRIFVVPPLNPSPFGSPNVTSALTSAATAAADSLLTMVALPSEFQNSAFTSTHPGSWCSLDGLHLNGGARAGLDGNCQGLIWYSVAMAVQAALTPAGGGSFVVVQ